MRPASSATGINSAGVMALCARARPADERFHARYLARGDADERLVLNLEIAIVERCAEIHLEAAARLHAGVHLRLEVAERAFAVALRLVERHIGILEQLDGVLTVARAQARCRYWRQREPDARGCRRARR